MKKINISPSLICMDLCNLEKEAKQMEQLGCQMLHVDIIDGRFSPDMPVGIDTVKQLRKKTNMRFDTHLMSKDNAPYVDLLLSAGVDRLCFHIDFEARPNILLRKIRSSGCQSGLAVSPETSVEALLPLLPLCDFLLFMRIDAGYAHLPNQQVYPHVNEKIAAIRNYCQKNTLSIDFGVDGRVGFDDIAPLSGLGITTFVSGNKGVFFPGGSREENWKRLESIIFEINK